VLGYGADVAAPAHAPTALGGARLGDRARLT
jgi:hypothetical protein